MDPEQGRGLPTKGRFRISTLGEECNTTDSDANTSVSGGSDNSWSKESVTCSSREGSNVSLSNNEHGYTGAEKTSNSSAGDEGVRIINETGSNRKLYRNQSLPTSQNALVHDELFYGAIVHGGWSVAGASGDPDHPRASIVSSTSGRHRPPIASGPTVPHELVVELFNPETSMEIQNHPYIVPPHDNHGKLGTFLGVYIPTIEQMWGVIIFVRFGLVLGQCGVATALAVTIISAIMAALTACSVSALSTNGIFKGKGGAFQLLTRSLGPALGGSICCMYVLSLAAMSAIELAGFAEALGSVVSYETGIVHICGSLYKDQIAFGVSMLIILCVIILISARAVHQIGTAFFAILLLGYLSSFVGLFASASGWGVGEVQVPGNHTVVVSGLSLSNLRQNLKPGPGFTLSTLRKAMGFTVPSFIGLFAGANSAHYLKTPYTSIPRGLFAGITTSMLLYSLIFVLMASVAPRETLVYHFLLFEEIAWPSRWLAISGMLVVGIGAAMHLLTISANVLQQLAHENVIPGFQRAKLGSVAQHGVPIQATLLSTTLALFFVLLPGLELIAAVVTVLFLITYMATNLCCALMSLFSAPSWRPTFKHYHAWYTAVSGVVVCFIIMLFMSWPSTIIAIAGFTILAFYLEVKSGAEIWGHGIKGLQTFLALRMLQDQEYKAYVPVDTTLDTSYTEAQDNEIEAEYMSESLHVKMPSSHVTRPLRQRPWAPQILAFVAIENTPPQFYDLLRMLSSKPRHSLLILGSVLQIEEKAISTGLTELQPLVEAAKQQLHVQAQEHGLRCFVEVVAAESIASGQRVLLEVVGLGSLKPNMCVQGWPTDWRQHPDAARRAAHAIMDVRAMNRGLVLIKDAEKFPTYEERVSGGTIDTWWLVQSCGLAVMIAWILSAHRVWSQCRLRVLTIAGEDMNSIFLEEQIQNLLRHLRIEASVRVCEVPSTAYDHYATVRSARLPSPPIAAATINPGHLQSGSGVMKIDLSRMQQALKNKTYLDDNMNVRTDTFDNDGFSPPATPQPLFSAKAFGALTNITPTNTHRLPEMPVEVIRNIIHRESQDAALVVLDLHAAGTHHSAEDFLQAAENIAEGLQRTLFVNGDIEGTHIMSMYNE